jgi:hypothetical protein
LYYFLNEMSKNFNGKQDIMEVIVFETETYWKMQEQLMKMFQDALRDAQIAPDDWISPEASKALLGVKSKSKMQQLRDTNAIKYSKHSRKLIRYSKSSILAYLKKNIPAY